MQASAGFSRTVDLLAQSHLLPLYVDVRCDSSQYSEGGECSLFPKTLHLPYQYKEGGGNYITPPALAPPSNLPPANTTDLGLVASLEKWSLAQLQALGRLGWSLDSSMSLLSEVAELTFGSALLEDVIVHSAALAVAVAYDESARLASGDESGAVKVRVDADLDDAKILLLGEGSAFDGGGHGAAEATLPDGTVIHFAGHGSLPKRGTTRQPRHDRRDEHNEHEHGHGDVDHQREHGFQDTEGTASGRRLQESPSPGCAADDSKCSSPAGFGVDCCACDASIGMKGCGWDEPATCCDP